MKEVIFLWNPFVVLGIYRILQDELPDLEPVIESPPVSFQFETPGWYVVFMILFCALLYGGIRVRNRYRKRFYRREALGSLDILSRSLKEGQTSSVLLATKVILKRVAIQSYGREEAAARYGLDWLKFLEAKGNNTPFSTYLDIWEVSSGTESGPDLERVRALLETTMKWIRTHA